MLGTVDPRLVTTNPQIPVVYRGRDNIVQSVFTRFDGKRFLAMDFTGVSRMVLILPVENGNQFVFDSLTSPTVFDWSLGGGRVVFDLTAYGLPVGSYDSQLVAFDAEHPGGQVIVDGQDKARLVIDVREVYTAGVLPPPLPTGGESVVRKAGQTISALRGVYELNGRVFTLDPLDPDQYRYVEFFLGITVNGAPEGGDVIVQRSGTLDDGSWSWAQALVYLGRQGRLTQIAPTTGWEMVMGSAPAPNRLNLSFDEPVLLAQEQ